MMNFGSRDEEASVQLTDVKEVALPGEEVAAKGCSKFGAKLYELKEDENRQGGACNQLLKKVLGMKKEKTIAFHRTAVVVTETSKLGCYPSSYSRTVTPRYKIVNAALTKVDVTKCIAIGAFGTLIGIVFMIVGGTLDDGAPFIGVGVVALLAGLFALAWPFLNVNYTIDLQLRDETPRDESAPSVMACLQACFSPRAASGAENFHITTSIKPDDTFLFDYVYGAVSDDIEALCMLSQLENSRLISSVKPKRLCDVGPRGTTFRPLGRPHQSFSLLATKTKTSSPPSPATPLTSAKQR